jgi:hypothetical protein
MSERWEKGWKYWEDDEERVNQLLDGFKETREVPVN